MEPVYTIEVKNTGAHYRPYYGMVMKDGVYTGLYTGQCTSEGRAREAARELLRKDKAV